MVGHEVFDVVLHVHIPVVYPNDCLWSSVDYPRSGRWEIHDIVQSELDGTIIGEVQDIVSMLDSGGDSILFSPFGGIGDEMPLILPFICLHL